MDPNTFKVLSTEDLINRFGRTDLLPIKIDRDFYKKMRTNLVIPSTNQSFSMVVEYMTKWFYDKFPERFFRSKYLEASHIMDTLRSMTQKQLVGNMKPASTIVADLDMSYTRENLDLYNMGILLYQNKCHYRDAFFIDRDKHLFVSLATELILMNFTFKIRVDTRSMQIDVAKMCQLAFRSGGSEKHYNDIDFPVPNELIMQIADDAGFCPCTCMMDNIELMKYLNSHSKLPFFYKLNTATQNMEWFVKIPRSIIHIKVGDIQIGSGIVKGMINVDHDITFDAQVRFPAPKFYAYYSIIARENVKSIHQISSGMYIQTVTNLSRVPEKDEHGWQWTVHTEYAFNGKEEIDDIKHKRFDRLKICFDELIGDLRTVIDYTKSIAISPEVFLNIRLYSFDKLVKTHIDWQTYTIHIDEPIESANCYLIIYMDNNYMNEQISNIREYDKHRIQPSDNQIGPNITPRTRTPQSSSSLSNL